MVFRFSCADNTEEGTNVLSNGDCLPLHPASGAKVLDKLFIARMFMQR